jgi:general secretion pathway protein J
MKRVRYIGAAPRGMTLLEVIVALSILSMIALLIYGAFDSLSRGKKGEAMRGDKYRQGREAMSRISREMSSAFLSGHNPLVAANVIRKTVFIGEHSNSGDRVDFASFAHLRTERDRPESDQAEVGYFLAKDPAKDDKFDLVRREQTPLDMEPRRGGVTQVVAEDVERFELKYLDPISGQWSDSWDTTQTSGQPNRMPLEVRVTLVLKAVRGNDGLRFDEKIMLQIREPLTFGLPR